MEKDKRNYKLKIKLLFTIFIVVSVLGMLASNVFAADNVNEEEQQYMYLSDISYKSGKTAWGKILMDTTSAGSKITLNINGSAATFDKGIWAHATSEMVYDISAYNQKYAYFTTYYGVNTTSGNNGNGVKFYIYTSVDGSNWTIVTDEKPTALKSANNCIFVKIPIKDVKYIKLYAHDNGANGNDHSVWADAKLIKEGYREDVTATVQEYDELIKDKYNKGQIDSELELLILQRELVNRIGSYTLNTFVKADPVNNKATLDWLMNDKETLKLYLVGGRPEGTYLKSLEVLNTMYNKYKSDLETTEISKYGTPLKDLYRKMILSISLTHSGKVYLWINGTNQSTPETRYEIYKKLYSNDLIESKIFEQLTVEEMRWVMNTVIDDEEIEWLNNYTRTVKKGATGPYSYIRYTFGYNYSLNKYYDQENYETWNEKYKLSDYGVTYGNKSFPKLWIVFEEGSVCGGLSKTGSCVWGSYKGLPNTCVCQPGHCAYIYYSKNANGKGVWGLGNDVSGWGQSGKTEHLNVRMMNDWGNTGVSGWAASYILLAQAAQNEYQKYEDAEIKMMLSRVFEGDKEKQEQIYREALGIEQINYDAWLDLVNLYLKDSTKTEADYYRLAEEIANALTYYPHPMYDLINRLQSKFTSAGYIAQFNSLKTRTLRTATKAEDKDTIQKTAVRQVANYLLGSCDDTVAKFSFDGDNAKKIVLADKFGNTDVYWEYSLNGGTSWSNTIDSHSIKLPDNEIASITAENDIKVHIIGTNYDANNIYTIDIKESAGLPKTLYANDLENKLIAASNNMEWRYTNTDSWTLYSEAEPNLNGDCSVIVRVAATGTYLASGEQTYNFTQEEEDLNNSYVKIEHLSVEAFSSENIRSNKNEYEYARNAIDGNLNTWWHTSRTSSTDERYIVIKLDKPMYISKLEYIPIQNYVYGLMKNGMVYTSLDGENWTETYEIKELARDYTTKTLQFERPAYTQYVKIKCNNSYDPAVSGKPNTEYFINAAMINFYQDLTKTIPTAEIEYSRNQITALPVTAKIINGSEGITITNNEGKDSYTFYENGEFIFEFTDKSGNQGSIKAEVDWIVDYSFAFDGEDPNTIILSTKYKNLTWEYSIDGGVTWTRKNELSYTLTPEELSMITSEKDLKVRIITSENVEDLEIKTIDILAGENLPTNLYGNDWENSVIGATENMEWRFVGDDNWTSYKNQKPDLTGNKTIEVRNRARGTMLAGSDSKEFTFTQDIQNDTKVYIPISHLSIYDCSAEATDRGEHAKNAIDGNINTMWHTNHDSTNEPKRYITIKLDKPRYISQLQYVPKPNYKWGVMKDCVIYTSIDGENWTEAAKATEVPFDETVKTIELKESPYAQYVKLQITSSYDGESSNNAESDYFAHAAIINLYSNTTIKYEAVVDILYDIEEPTEKNVTARIVCRNSSITITNNNGKDTYVFTENGEFTFEYKDELGNDGTAKAEVTWITPKKEEPIIPNPPEPSEEIILGDVDGDKQVTINDLAQVKLHLIGKQMISSEKLKAADVDKDNEITINDLAQIKLYLIGRLQFTN